jgi:hypothetical protein
MTQVGKKLQDIYDSGATALVETQEQAVKNFERVGKEHVQNTKQSAEKSSLALQEKSGHLQNELKELMQASMARLENAAMTESKRNQAFVVSLIAELQTRTEQMKSKLGALGQAHHENVDFAFNLARQHYLSSLETAKIGLDESASQHQVGLSAYAATIIDKALQTTEQGFWQQHEQSTEVSATFFNTAREQEKIIYDRSSALAQTLSVSCQTRLKNAKTLADKATEEVETSIRSLLDVIAKHASSIEKDSNERYSRLTDGHFQKVDARLSDFADELSNLHDGVTDQLTKNTEELSTDLLSASAQAQEGLRIKCDQAVSTVNSDFASFKKNVETRLQLSRGQKRTLEEDKNKILIAIKNELLSIHDSFAKKIATLLSSTKTELAEMTKSVEGKIVAAMDTCNEQVGISATTAQKQIEDEVEAFLKELSNSRSSAVGEITASAHGSLPLVNVSEPVEKSSTITESPKPIKEIIEKPEEEEEETFDLDAFATGLELQPIVLSESLLQTNLEEGQNADREDTDEGKTSKKNRRRKANDLNEKEENEDI